GGGVGTRLVVSETGERSGGGSDRRGMPAPRVGSAPGWYWHIGAGRKGLGPSLPLGQCSLQRRDSIQGFPGALVEVVYRARKRDASWAESNRRLFLAGRFCTALVQSSLFS
ncbi:unnamed protein product, partial [Scytosiphon promiscuus]